MKEFNKKVATTSTVETVYDNGSDATVNNYFSDAEVENHWNFIEGVIQSFIEDGDKWFHITYQKDALAAYAHSIGVSKIMWLTAVERYINDMYNEDGYHAWWKRLSYDEYSVIVAHESILTDEAKKHFELEKTA